jgi:hypothetical protein
MYMYYSMPRCIANFHRAFPQSWYVIVMLRTGSLLLSEQYAYIQTYYTIGRQLVVVEQSA